MRLPRHQVLILTRRLLLVWAIEGAAVWLLDRLLPGFDLVSWQTAVWAALAIGLLNGIVRPVLLLLALPFTLVSFGVITLLLNALMIELAAHVVPGFHVADLLTALIAALGLAAINIIITAALSVHDEGSFYHYVMRRLARHAVPEEKMGQRGVIIVEIDGLSEPALRDALSGGYMPHLQKWMVSGSHRLVQWDCGLPSQTSSSQAGILHGNNFDIPAFRWYEKDSERLMVSSHPADASEIERRCSQGDDLLYPDGASVGNMLSGGAGHVELTLSKLSEQGWRLRHPSANFYMYFLNPYNFSRSLVLMAWEIMIELWEGWGQRLRNVRPRVHRGGSFPLRRAVSTVLMRELDTYLLISEIFSGVPVAYTSFVGYDVVAHHAGPDSKDALRVLHGIDRRIASLRRAAAESPRDYDFVILSDHGHSRGATFKQRAGMSLEEMVKSLLSGDTDVSVSVGRGEGWDHVNALLSRAVRERRLGGRAAARILRRRTRDGFVELGAGKGSRPAKMARVVVCASGNLALIYFSALKHRLSLEAIAREYPGLIEGTVGHEVVGFVMARSDEQGPVVIGKNGVHYLHDGQVKGDDPLAPFGPRAADHLRRLDSFPHVGDLLVNSFYDPDTDEVAAFEELVGSHGGLGGLQTNAFLMCPSHWTVGEHPLEGPLDVHALLRRHLDVA